MEDAWPRGILEGVDGELPKDRPSHRDKSGFDREGPADDGDGELLNTNRHHEIKTPKGELLHAATCRIILCDDVSTSNPVTKSIVATQRLLSLHHLQSYPCIVPRFCDDFHGRLRILDVYCFLFAPFMGQCLVVEQCMTRSSFR